MDEIAGDEPPPPVRNVGRRKSVFAEAYNPEEDEDDKPPVRLLLSLRHVDFNDLEVFFVLGTIIIMGRGDEQVFT